MGSKKTNGHHNSPVAGADSSRPLSSSLGAIKPAKELRSITMEEVAQHNTKNDAWLVIDGWVLDITRFLDLHPGGASILKDVLGTDASEAFKDPAIHAHGVSARNLLRQFRIGYTPGQDMEKVKAEEANIKTPEDFGVDLSKGLLWQASQMGEEYQKFISSTLLAEAATLRYFDSDFLEFFSKSPWYTVPLIWIPGSILMFWIALAYGMPATFIPACIVFGFFTWQFAEYMLHKYVFHAYTSSPIGNYFHMMLHGYHHICPMDRMRLTFPPVPTACIGLFLFAIIRVFLPFNYAIGLSGGLTIGYIYYDLMHYYLHHAAIKNETLRDLKKHHLYHHYSDETTNMGISTKIFDSVFGTYNKIQLRKLKKKV